MFRVGVLSYNVVSGLRAALLDETLASIQRAFPDAEWHLLDNGSSDHSFVDYKPPLGWFFHSTIAESTTPGAGRNRLVAAMVAGGKGSPGDIVVLSDDDMRWRPGAQATLHDFWHYAAADLAIAGCYLEPEYPWSRPIETLTVGGVRALVRETVPAAAWSFPRRVWTAAVGLGPLKTTLEGDGEDIDACRRLAAAGKRVVAIDLAEHIGAGYSQLGNDEARRLIGKPINKKAWEL